MANRITLRDRWDAIKPTWSKPQGILGWLFFAWWAGGWTLDMIGRYQTAHAIDWLAIWASIQSTPAWEKLVRIASLALTPSGQLAVGICGLLLIWSATSPAPPEQTERVELEPSLPGFDFTQLDSITDEIDRLTNPFSPKRDDSPLRADFRKRVRSLCQDYQAFEEERDRGHPYELPEDPELQRMRRRVEYSNETARIAADRFQPRFEAIHKELLTLGIDDGKLHRAIAERSWAAAVIHLPRLIDRVP